MIQRVFEGMQDYRFEYPVRFRILGCGGFLWCSISTKYSETLNSRRYIVLNSICVIATVFATEPEASAPFARSKSEGGISSHFTGDGRSTDQEYAEIQLIFSASQSSIDLEVYAAFTPFANSFRWTR